MKTFFVLWTGQAISLFGSQLVQFALIWWLTKETGSGTVLALASIVALVPQAILGPIAGTFVDRWNRRWTLFVADSLVGLATAGLALLFLTNSVDIWHVYVILFVRSVASSFHWPAMAASTSLMVPEEQLARIQGVNQTLIGALNIVSAPLSAILLGILPIQGILAIDIITLFFALTPLLFIQIPQPKKTISDDPSAAVGSSFWEDMKKGLRYVGSWPGLLIILLMATVINFVLTPAFALLPLVVTEHFKGGALQLGWLEASWGIGVVAGGIFLGVWGGFSRRIKTTLSGLLFMGAFVVLFGLVPGGMILIAVGVIFFVGVMNPIVNGPVLALVQSIVAHDMQGRVFGLTASAVSIMSPLGLAIAGPLSDTVGIRVWFVLGGLLTIVIGVVGFLIPAVYHIEDHHLLKSDEEEHLALATESEPSKSGSITISI
jgi:DHA3 family macrolide efflux protein-like MFS transporter